jgi:hypothetical protein
MNDRSTEETMGEVACVNWNLMLGTGVCALSPPNSNLSDI